MDPMKSCIRAECAQPRGHQGPCDDERDYSQPVRLTHFYVHWQCAECRKRSKTKVRANWRGKLWQRCSGRGRSYKKCHGVKLVSYVSIAHTSQAIG